ncbi:hypothetical protein D4764_03G0010130 [Takifugu flavidus]|uniref:Uncharacterized protein n=1 Tax=Takifugu flavidus TaxID=433684 RepID=A0A5C6NA82_9TELE|nr:hypothetical protein D4764_03G0010130 [Takifugu flavidus]
MKDVRGGVKEVQECVSAGVGVGGGVGMGVKLQWALDQDASLAGSDPMMYSELQLVIEAGDKDSTAHCSQPLPTQQLSRKNCYSVTYPQSFIWFYGISDQHQSTIALM